MADLKRALRGAFPGPAIEPNATLRTELADLGHTGVRYGWVRAESTAGGPSGPAFLREDSGYILREDGSFMLRES